MKIRIVNRYYTLNFATPEPCDKAELDGWIDYHKREIFIDAGLGASKTREVIWHEIIHALWHEYAFVDRRSEEETVTWAARAIESFIAANGPFVRKYLL